MVRDFCGHGISTVFHEPPNVLHYGMKNTGIEIKPGIKKDPLLHERKNLFLVSITIFKKS